MTILGDKENFSGAIRQVDATHRKPGEMMQRLGNSEASLVKLLGNLYTSYTKHFAYEEAIMRACCHDGYDEHQADHQRLLDEITTAMFHCRSRGQHDNAQVARQLADSFRAHLQNYDQHLKRQTDRVSKAV